MNSATSGTSREIFRKVEAAVLAKLREQEPYCYHDGRNIVGKEFASHSDVFPLYAAPLPAVVQVPQEFTATADNDFAYGYQDGWNACRKAMLAAAPEAPAQEKSNG